MKKKYIQPKIEENGRPKLQKLKKPLAIFIFIFISIFCLTIEQAPSEESPKNASKKITINNSEKVDEKENSEKETSIGEKILKFFYDDEFKKDENFQRHRLEFETGAAQVVYNRIGKNDSTGAFFDASKINNSINFYFRISYYFNLDKNNSFKIMIAPFKYSGNGNLGTSFSNDGQSFQNALSSFSYQFNSYRFTYRRSIFSNKYVTVRLGLTLKVRDASFSIIQGNSVFSQRDVGFVPLGHFNLEFNPLEKLYFIIEGDFGAVPQGRAIDFAFSCKYEIAKNIDFSLGYRFLEGGAFNQKAFQRIFVNYFFASIGFRI